MTDSISALNAATDAALTGRAAEAAKTPAPKRPAAKRPAPKRPAPKVAVKPSGRKALTPKERYGRPVTATIDSYLTWLEKNVLGRKMTKAERAVAGGAITLYGAYQISPERRAARLGK